MAVHHATLGVEAFGSHACVEVLDHLRGPVGGQHLRAEPCGREAQAAGPSGDVEERVARLQSGQPKSGRCQFGLTWCDMLVVKGSDRIPRLDGRGVLACCAVSCCRSVISGSFLRTFPDVEER